jgi:hypothetical protein
LVDGLHNSNTQLVSQEAVGMYLTNLDIRIQGVRENGKSDPDHIYWIRSSPETQSTEHTIGRSWQSNDHYALSMNLGYNGKDWSGGMKFDASHTFTASYTENRDITDWSVVENTNPVSSTGQWRYHQKWPVDMLLNDLDTFGRTWEFYFERPWNPCQVRDVPNLSKYALSTHDSMVWAIDPTLRAPRSRELPIKFQLALTAKVAAHTCEVYDGHHKMAQANAEFNDMGWTINVADLNNIKWQ